MRSLVHSRKERHGTGYGHARAGRDASQPGGAVGDRPAGPKQRPPAQPGDPQGHPSSFGARGCLGSRHEGGEGMTRRSNPPGASWGAGEAAGPGAELHPDVSALSAPGARRAAPRYQLLPDLSPAEYEALKADIAARGVLV